jgi:hypothetical protein
MEVKLNRREKKGKVEDNVWLRFWMADDDARWMRREARRAAFESHVALQRCARFRRGV